MRLKIMAMFALGFLAFMVSCKNSSSEESSEEEINTEIESEATIPDHDIGVVLINNERWQANPETTAGMISMLQHLESFKQNPDSYPLLKQRLETEFSLLVESCTMKGEAHEQLHNYLLPIVASFDALDSENEEIASEGVNNLEQHLRLYTVYFK